MTSSTALIDLINMFPKPLGIIMATIVLLASLTVVLVLIIRYLDNRNCEVQNGS